MVDLLVVVAVGVLAGLVNVTVGAVLQRMPLAQFVRTFTRLDPSSLALSYTRGLWVQVRGRRGGSRFTSSSGRRSSFWGPSRRCSWRASSAGDDTR